jgi:DNA repair protein RadA/Sms
MFLVKNKQIKWGRKNHSTSDNCYILTETKPKHLQTNWRDWARNCNHWFDSNLIPIIWIHCRKSISNWETTAELIKETTHILIGHITKDGNMAQKNLEHMVDTVLQFEGDRNHVYRILRSLKILWFYSWNGIYENVRKWLTWSFKSFWDINFA